MKPIKITAHMQDGRVAGNETYFPLDSILAAAWMRRHHPDAFYNPGSHLLDHELIIPELPLAKRGNGEHWYYACSFNQAPKLGEYILHWHKRFDDQLEQYIDFGGRRGKINTTSAKFKAYRMPLVVQLFDRLEWYAVGDPEAVLDLCRCITHIGKKSSQGLGAVDYWEVEPWPEDWSVWGPDNRLMRAIPMEEGIPHNVSNWLRVAQNGLRPPYWHIQNQVSCYVP